VVSLTGLLVMKSLNFGFFFSFSFFLASSSFLHSLCWNRSNSSWVSLASAASTSSCLVCSSQAAFFVLFSTSQVLERQMATASLVTSAVVRAVQTMSYATDEKSSRTSRLGSCVICGICRRSYQCPPNSCRNPVILAESGGIWWNKIWQEGLLFFFIPVPFIPAEFGHSRIETGMFCGIRRNRMQWNPVVCLFVCLFHTCYQTNHQPNTV